MCFFRRKQSVSELNLTSACFSISCKTLFAGTSVRSNSIFALSTNVTGISASSTLIDILEQKITKWFQVWKDRNFLFQAPLSHLTARLNSQKPCNYDTTKRYHFACMLRHLIGKSEEDCFSLAGRTRQLVK